MLKNKKTNFLLFLEQNMILSLQTSVIFVSKHFDRSCFFALFNTSLYQRILSMRVHVHLQCKQEMESI